MKSVYWNNILFQDRIRNMKERIQKSIALKVKALRESVGLTQEQLADKCDVSWRTISNLERGLVVPDLIMLVKIAKLFDVKVDDLIGLKVDSNKSRSRLEREQSAIEKLTNLNDSALNFVLDELILLFKYFN